MSPSALASTPHLRATDVFGRSWDRRRVTVVGLGRSGNAAARLLGRAGCRVRVTDAQDTPALRAERASLTALGVEEVELGGHTRRLVDGAELLVVSPGVSESVDPVRWAEEAGVAVMGEIDLAFHFCQAPVIAVTGTNGKSTVVTLLADVLKASGRIAIACGNLGLPFSSVAPQLTAETVAVVEVSSFQLLACQAFRPAIGVLLNLGTNHLDRHPDADAYLAAKARLFQRQNASDWAVLNGTDPRVVELAQGVPSRRVWFGDNRTNPPELRLAPQTLRALSPGAQAVLQVARLSGLLDPLTWQIIRAFRGLEHRLEGVATIHGVRYVNDSKSTTPNSLLFALDQTRGDVVVILGGRDKGLDFHPLAARLHDARVRGVVLIGESRPRLRALLNGSTTVRESETLAEAVRAARALAAPGTTVLFSPACASFDMFANFEARGQAFKAIVDGWRGMG